MIVLGRSAFWLQDEVRRLRAKSVVGAAEPFRPSDRRTDRARAGGRTQPRTDGTGAVPCRGGRPVARRSLAARPTVGCGGR